MSKMKTDKDRVTEVAKNIFLLTNKYMLLIIPVHWKKKKKKKELS